MHFLLIYYIILFAHNKQHEHITNEGLSPNGKATDSDSVIFQVRILVALVERYSFEYLFFYAKYQKSMKSQFFSILYKNANHFLADFTSNFKNKRSWNIEIPTSNQLSIEYLSLTDTSSLLLRSFLLLCTALLSQLKKQYKNHHNRLFLLPVSTCQVSFQFHVEIHL